MNAASGGMDINERNVMKSTHLITATSLLVAVTFAVANAPGPQPTPSARLAMEIDVRPAKGEAGHFMFSSTITDLETNTVVGKPRLLIDSEKLARVETSVDGKWGLQISVVAGNASKKATYEASFTREGVLVSKQRFTVDLNG